MEDVKNYYLPARQFQMAKLAALGWTNAEIARRMKLSAYSVQHTLTVIYKRLGCTPVKPSTRLPRIELANLFSRGEIQHDRRSRKTTILR